MFRLARLLPLAVVVAVLLAAPVRAATMDPNVWVTNPQAKLKVAIAPPVNGQGPAQQVNQAIQDNLAFLSFVSIVDPRSVPGGAAQSVASGPDLDFRRFQLAGAHVLVTSLWKTESGRFTVELRAYDATTGKWIFGNSYANVTNATAPDMADSFCADLTDALTGNGDFFRSTLVFVKTGGHNKKDVWAVKPTGRGLRRLTNMPGDALSPTWSRDGRFVIFSHVDVRTHGLGVWDSQSGQVRRIRFPGNTVIGPSFTPDNKVLISLSTGKNPGIFLLDHQFRREKTIENSASIDVSPSVDASGTKMAFVSSRMGNPHIFLKDLRTGAVRRITYEGRYNTEPSISPDGSLIAFSRRVQGNFRIFVYDLERQTETQVSFGPGNDEQPAFAPDNFFIAFTSNRSGSRQLYLTTRNGGDARPLATGAGDASFPAWGPPVK